MSCVRDVLPQPYNLSDENIARPIYGDQPRPGVIPLVIAHRGASWEEPENTLPAFERAIEDGADYVEFDLHAARDGSLVVVHGRPRRSRSYPTLAEVIELAAGRIGLMVELKHPYLYRRHDVVGRTLELLDDDAVIISFEPGTLRTVRRLRPSLRTVQHLSFGVSIKRAGNAWAVGFADERLTPRALARAQLAGFETTVYTVNDPARMLELATLGVTGIFTDRPDLARRVLAPRAG
jgi:glycerophosphoryl diester phosphodiesterase